MTQSKQLFQDFIDFYQDQLLLGFYRKRGKSLIVPNIIFCLERLLGQAKENKIRVLDLGCGAGNLLRVILEFLKIRKIEEKVELFGLDYNPELLEKGKKISQNKIKFFCRDLRSDNLTDLFGGFDLLLCVNTLHEVFSNFVLSCRDQFEAENRAKLKLQAISLKLGKLLSQDGTFIFYDGLNLDKKERDETVRFKVKTKILEANLNRFFSEYQVYQLKPQKIADKVYQLKKGEFLIFLSTFKYLGSKLWPIESKETYHYLDLNEFKQLFKMMGLRIEFLARISNDLGLWKEHVEILSKNTEFPDKSILLVGSKRYLVSKYELFC